MIFYGINQIKSVSLKILLWIILTRCLIAVNSESDNSFNSNIVEQLVKKWAPLVWLAPSEKFMPGDVLEFLQHVYPQKFKTNNKYENELDGNAYYNADYDELGALLNNNIEWETRNKRNLKARNLVLDLPTGYDSEDWSLVTKTDIGELLKNKSSFLYGKDPTDGTIPVYAMINLCRPEEHESTRENEITKESEPVFESFDYNSQPYIPLSLNNPVVNYKIYEPIDFDNQNPQQNQETIISVNANIPAETINNQRYLNDQFEPSKNEEIDYIDNQNNNTEEQIFNEIINYENQYLNYKPQEDETNFIPKFHVTYWMFYPYSQGKQVCTVNLGPFGIVPIPFIFGICLGTRKVFGSHVGDWEHISLHFNGKAEPEKMYVSAHDAGAYYSYEKLTGTFNFVSQETRKGILQRPIFPKTVLTSGNHPVLFAAQGSHGLWTAPGKHRFVRVPRLYDINGFGRPWPTWKRVEINYNNNLFKDTPFSSKWLQYRGRWGNPKSKCHPIRRIGINFCEHNDGPTGIPMKRPHFTCNAKHSK